MKHQFQGGCLLLKMRPMQIVQGSNGGFGGQEGFDSILARGRGRNLACVY